ncbi:MAG TPA: 2-hydroxyacyl-CoA dehydratase family protein [Spirochaetota bacterium]|nr:2-hydroxyacyl-CoA dehydratase family protein [Spirochaetota bacterium]
MHESKLSYLVDPMREMLFQAQDVLRSYKERSGVMLAGLSCDFLPAEVLASFGVVPVRIPAHLRIGRCGDGPAFDRDLLARFPYDFYVEPAGCRALSSTVGIAAPVHEFRVPAGYGETARVLRHEEIVGLMTKAGAPGMDPSSLRGHADEYNAMRRLVRGILSVRAAKPELLSHEDLSVLIEAASALPPVSVIEPLALVLRELNSGGSGPGGSGMVPAMVYGGFLGDAGVLDLIEEEGVLIAEDDLCGGRRHFDLSINTSAEDLLLEILDAFTYRPLCPRVRSGRERFDLLYKLLKSHGIDLVIFIAEGSCGCRAEGIEFLRVRLMREGVDPLVVTGEDAPETVRRYLKSR